MGAFVYRVLARSDCAAGCSLNQRQSARDQGRPLRVAVTGASGFIGGHLARLLAQRGFVVTALLRRIGQAEHLQAAGVKVLSTPNIVLPMGTEVVVHAAATSPSAGVTAAELVVNNVDLSRSLIEQAQAIGVRCFVFLSSMSIYGEINELSVDESTPQVNLDLYGMTKRIGEAFLEKHAGAMTSLSIRLPAVVGRGAARHWLAEAAQRLIVHQDVSVFHPTAPFNNAIHVNDLAVLIGNAIESMSGGYEVINVASDGHIEVLEALKILRWSLGSRSRIVEVSPLRPSFTISITRATKLFDFRPMPIDEALAQYGRDLNEQVSSPQTRVDGFLSERL